MTAVVPDETRPARPEEELHCRQMMKLMSAFVAEEVEERVVVVAVKGWEGGCRGMCRRRGRGS
jgi:hypothetical protein